MNEGIHYELLEVDLCPQCNKSLIPAKEALISSSEVRGIRIATP